MKTKSLSALLVAALFSSIALVGCNTASTSNHSTDPAVIVTANHKRIVAGETVLVTAQTINASSKDIKWTYTPNAGGVKVVPESDMAGKTAKFTADQPGTYAVRATVDGAWNETTIVVDARPGTN